MAFALLFNSTDMATLMNAIQNATTANQFNTTIPGPTITLPNGSVLDSSGAQGLNARTLSRAIYNGGLSAYQANPTAAQWVAPVQYQQGDVNTKLVPITATIGSGGNAQTVTKAMAGGLMAFIASLTFATDDGISGAIGGDIISQSIEPYPPV